MWNELLYMIRRWWWEVLLIGAISIAFILPLFFTNSSTVFFFNFGSSFSEAIIPTAEFVEKVIVELLILTCITSVMVYTIFIIKKQKIEMHEKIYKWLGYMIVAILLLWQFTSSFLTYVLDYPYFFALLIFVFFVLSTEIFSVFLAEEKIKKEVLKKVMRNRICFRVFLFLSSFLVFCFLFLFLIQVEIICLDCFSQKKYWGFLLYYSCIAGLAIVSVHVYILYTLFFSRSPEYESPAYERMNEFEERFTNLFMNIINTYFTKENIFKTALVSKLILIFLLLLIYWVDYSATPTLKDSRCKPEIADCSLLLQETFSQKYFPQKVNPKENSGEPAATDSREVRLEAITNIIRNKWVWIFAFLGISLAFWGRLISHQQTKQTQKSIELASEQLLLTRQSNINENYDKLVQMLEKNLMSTRIAGCQGLVELAKYDDDMLFPCSSLLLAYIKEPYFPKDEGKEEFFPDEELRADIQEAIKSVSAIYKYSYDKKEKHERLNGKIISLPKYFWKNKKKEKLFFGRSNFSFQKMQDAFLKDANFENSNMVKANIANAYFEIVYLQGAKLRKAVLKDVEFLEVYLENANLEKANLENAVLQKVNLENVNLRKVNLKNATLLKVNVEGANFVGADITNADLQYTDGLTADQVLTARWGIGEDGEINHPELPKELTNTQSIKNWLNNPSYDNSSEKE